MEANSLVNSGILPANLATTTATYNCTTLNYTNCSIPGETGCAANANNCQIGGATGVDSLFNPNSPFTPILEGNIYGLFSEITGGGLGSSVNHGPYDASGGGAYITGSCAGEFTTAGDKYDSLDIASCTQTLDNANVSTPGNASTITNWNPTTSLVDYAQPIYNWTSGSTNLFVCFWQQSYNYSSSDGYNWYGCDLQARAPVNGTSSVAIWSILVSIPTSTVYASDVPVSSYLHLNVYLQGEGWDTEGCSDSISLPQSFGDFGSSACTNFFQNVENQKGSFSDFGFFGPIVGLAVGIALFLVGLNMTVSASGSVLGSGTSFLVGTGPQGARLAQSIGIGLIVWTPMFSEFGGWLTSGLLGSTGLGILTLFLVTGAFFFGAFWQALSYS